MKANESVLFLVLAVFLSTDHPAKPYYSATLQQYFSARFFMCLNMDYETDTPTFTMKEFALSPCNRSK